jgi:hypothetical protein
MQPPPSCGAGHKPRQMQSGAKQQRSRPVVHTERLLSNKVEPDNIMTVILENRQLFAEKTIVTPYPMGFAELVAFIRSVEPDRAWQIAEYG